MLSKALPFFISYLTIPMVLAAAWFGGWWIAVPFVWGWMIISMLDQFTGLNTDNMDPATQERMQRMDSLAARFHRMRRWSRLVHLPPQLAGMPYLWRRHGQKVPVQLEWLPM